MDTKAEPPVKGAKGGAQGRRGPRKRRARPKEVYRHGKTVVLEDEKGGRRLQRPVTG